MNDVDKLLESIQGGDEEQRCEDERWQKVANRFYEFKQALEAICRYTNPVKQDFISGWAREICSHRDLLRDREARLSELKQTASDEFILLAVELFRLAICNDRTAIEDVIRKLSKRRGPDRGAGTLRSSIEAVAQYLLEYEEPPRGFEATSIELEVTTTEAENDEAPLKKRSTESGEARIKLISALTEHHGYTNGSCSNTAPIASNELARRAKVVKSSASLFFKNEFGGHSKYKVCCHQSASALVAALKVLNDGYSPLALYGSKPPCDNDPDE